MNRRGFLKILGRAGMVAALAPTVAALKPLATELPKATGGAITFDMLQAAYRNCYNANRIDVLVTHPMVMKRYLELLRHETAESQNADVRTDSERGGIWASVTRAEG